ncbi:hypothetical protein AYX15_07172 [Cryptococcus neoformans]|nr:hypothetical protein AYX15_07172 [Cryptococcus neoformans var. grubii]
MPALRKTGDRAACAWHRSFRQTASHPIRQQSPV